MRVRQYSYSVETGWEHGNQEADFHATVLLAFYSDNTDYPQVLKTWHSNNFPNVPLLGCSTAGEIQNIEVKQASIVVTAIEFSATHVVLKSQSFDETCEGKEVGQSLAKQFEHKDLQLFFVLSDGLNINGTHFIEGLTSELPENVVVTGGMAGDGDRFEGTSLVVNGDIYERSVAALAFYGDALELGYGSRGGWDPFGPDRLVTRSEGSTLYELDGQSALELYKQYLGEHAQDLPSSGLRFPLKIRDTKGKEYVRTLLAIDESQGSMTFAGNVPEGAYARLMKANHDRLIDGAIAAAEKTQPFHDEAPTLALLISCVGRKIVMEQRIEEEVEGVKSILGESVDIAGFYSYGEFCPLSEEDSCTLHNQTMTITTLRERSAE